ncbi:MAG: DUF4199 domain-containing protein [Bacteroidales bacterium]|jgi:hypothetical protein|nr:DUF4199 domain-containing protein [Bacteroidales bacterium]MCI1733343.1 DUF4199 domain-containing protein [Bacteroidales bacterium]
MEDFNNNMGAPVKETGKLSSASLDGLLLALITIVCSVINSLGVSGGFLGVIIWIVKIVATIWVLLYFMKRYSLRRASIYGETTYNQAFSYGFLVSLLSAVVIACFMYLSVTVLFPNTESDTMQKVQDAMAQQGSSMNEEQENAINAVMNNLPMILTFGMLIWCTIFGLIVSAIIASSVKQLPVEGFNPNNFDANNFNPDSFNNDVADSETTKPEDVTPDKTGDAKPEEPADKPAEPAENKNDESRFMPGGDKPEDPNDKYMPK